MGKNKVKLNNKLINESVIYLAKYLKKNKNKISHNKFLAIRKLMLKKRADNKKLAEEIVGSPLCKLAVTDLIRKRKMKQLKFANQTRYTVDAYDTLIKMINIVNNANKRGLGDRLNDYLTEL